MVTAPEEFYARVLAVADDQRRLPVPDQTTWDIFPFEPAGLVARRLDPLTLPEPPRQGEDGRECARCARPDERVAWSDEHWTLSGLGEPPGVPFAAILESRAHLDLGDLDDERAAELGRLIVTVERAARSLPGVARVHVNRWGDGCSHLHVFFFGRPAGMLQLRGSCLPLWEEMLPRVPAAAAGSALRSVAAALASRGGRLHE
jgi:diadenosine tetraphosphate (Ap4A) HIT family hydrolase